jgi:RNA polymerase sigma-70 factor (ECF subfamily)
MLQPLEEFNKETSTGLIELVERARRGDREAQGALFECYSPRICSYLTALVGNVEDARDLTTNTFLKAFEALGDCGKTDNRAPQGDSKEVSVGQSNSLKDSSKFKSWLYRIARNLANDYGRRQKRWQKIFKEMCNWKMPGREDYNDHIGEKELVQGALRKLSWQCRQCLLLHVIGNFSYKEIADMLSISETHVSVNICLAKKRLRKLLEGFLEEE